MLLAMLLTPAAGHAEAPDDADFTQVTTGTLHTVALKNDGTVWTWGQDDQGQMGDGTIGPNSATPTQINPAILTNVRSIAAGDTHTVALKNDGTVWTWGGDSYGQLGDGTIGPSSATPTQISPAILTNVRSIAAGERHTVALKNDGTVWTWGLDSYGQLGDGTIGPNSTTPTQINPAILANVRSITAGDYHTVALRNDGTVWTWGTDVSGQLGDGTIGPDSATPTQINPAILTDVRNITAGYGFTVAVKTDGTVWTWGDDSYGQLGDGTIGPNSATPTQINPAILNDVRSIDAGGDNGFHTVALKNDGTVWTWGYDDNGQLGDGTMGPNSATPTQASPAILTNVLSITDRSALKSDGTLWTWGYDGTGQLGDGTIGPNSATPTKIAFAQPCGFTQTAAGVYSTIALKNDGTVWAWGDDGYGQLGDGTIGPSSATPTQISPAILTNVRSITAGNAFAVALKNDGTVWTWGYDGSGQLGDGVNGPDSATPTQISPAILTNVRSISAGLLHTVALKNDGTVWTWGSDVSGQLGDGTMGGTSATPTQASPAILTNVRSITAGNNFTVALKNDGTVWAWGADAYGQLGDGSSGVGSATPSQISPAVLTNVGSIAAGERHAIALKNDGTVWTWGDDGSGQLGDTTIGPNSATPTQVNPVYLNPSVRSITGGFHSVALKINGNVATWGQDDAGQLGDGTIGPNSATPTQINSAILTNVRSITAGLYHTVALNHDGTIWTWGSDAYGQLGDGTIGPDSATPLGMVTPPCAAPPVTPSNVSPTTGTTSATPTLIASAFADPNGDAHTASQWQVRTDAGTYAAPFADSGVSGSALTSWAVPTALTAGTTYWFQVRYQDATGLWSAYSAETSFVYDPNAPLVPTLVSPANAASVTSSSLVATYLDSAPASSGRVEYEVCTTSGCGTVLESGYSSVIASGVNGAWSHTRPSGTYWWHARSVDAANATSGWTAARSFTFAQPPTMPSLVSPAAGAWVTSATPSLTASYSDPDGDAGRDVFQLCRTDAGATDWSNAANCASGFSTVSSASGASGVDKSAQPVAGLGQGNWYWRAASIDAGGGSSAFSAARLVRVDSLPPTTPANVQIARSGLGKITVSWSASTDTGIGGVTYDVDWSADGVTFSSVCVATTALTCQKSGLGGSSLPIMRVRACDGLGNCTTWQGRAGGSAQGYYLRTTIDSAAITGTADKRATAASGTANQTTAQRVDSGETGWMQLQPGALSTLNPVAGEPAGTPAGNFGWVIEETAGKSLAPGAWSITVTTDSDNDGVARIQCRAWIVTITTGAISASSNYQSAYTDSADVYAVGPQTHMCQLPGLATQTTLAANQYVYAELYVNATTGGSGMNKRLYLVAEGTGSAISIPPPGTAPSTPTVTSSALSDSTVDLAGTYTHAAGTQGVIEYEYATDAGYTSIVQTGSSILLTNGAPTTMTSEPIPSGSYFWRARSRDAADLVSAWTTGSVVVSSQPSTPTNTTPADASSTSDDTPQLTASAFSDVDSAVGDTHVSSQFQLALNGYDWSTGQDSGTIATTTSWTPPAALSVGSTYHWRARYLDAYGRWSNWSAVTSFTITAGGAITLSLDTSTLNLGVQTTGVDDFATVTATIATANPTGYLLTASGTSTGTNATTCTCTTPFADWTGTGTTPTIWTAGTAGYAAITVRNAQNGRLTKWGTGTATTETDTTNNKYAALTTTSITLHDRASSPTGNDTIPITIRTNPSAATSAATHTETITITATTNP